MAMIPIKRIFTKLFPKLSQQKETFNEDVFDVLDMFDKGEFEKAYKTLCNIMNKQSKWSNVGEVYAIRAELELLVNDDSCKALEFLDKAKELGNFEISHYYHVRGGQ